MHLPQEMIETDKYRCDTSSKMGAGRNGPNEPAATTFDQLAAYYETSKLPNAWWRVKGYRVAAGALRNTGKKISTYEDAVKLPGIGDKTARKLLEIVQTGKSTHLENKTLMDKVGDIFTKIYGNLRKCNRVQPRQRADVRLVAGVGPTKAAEWFNAGMRTLDDVRHSEKFGIKLMECQKLGLKYYDDINERMQRSEVSEHFAVIQKAGMYTFYALFQGACH